MISVAENRDRVFPAQYSLFEILAERITEAILSGGLKPGERIVERGLQGSRALAVVPCARR